MTAVHHRMGFVGGSDARRIIEGDWLALYEEKVGIRQPEDLSKVFRVQLGVWTEPFHFAWLRDQMGMALGQKAPLIQHPSLPWMQASIDGWLLDEETFIDLKHSNARATVRSMSETYQPQIAHYCAVFGVTHGYLSFIAGNEDPVVCKVEPSRTYIDELVELEANFWWHVENKVAPDQHMHAEQFAEVHAQAKNVKVNGMRFVDMQGNNQWADLARTIIETKAAAEQHEKAREDIKALVEKDVAEADGHGVTIKRDKKGALRFTIKEAA
jgi:hypothetical protein